VVAVVRGSGDDAAAQRLRAGFATGDAELLAEFDRLAEGRLQVYAGASHDPDGGGACGCRLQTRFVQKPPCLRMCM